MHYRHLYHAGNFADVFKHVLLVGLIDSLNRKAAPWCLVETHAGAGQYRLDTAEAARSGEWDEGIGRIWAAPAPPEPVAAYLDMVRRVQPDPAGSVPRVYPGSPLIAAARMRDIDRLVLCEKLPEVAAELQRALGRDERVAVHCRDGYEAVALLPPRERRGLVLIDPPFEQAGEFDALGDFLHKARQRFAHGIYAIWYPVKKRYEVERFLRRVAAQPAMAEALRIELAIGAPADGRMQACGLLVINPPFQFGQACAAALEWLRKGLARDARAATLLEPLQIKPR